MKTKIEDIQRIDKRHRSITIRVTKETSDWMKEKNISPTALFNSAINELRDEQK